MAPQPTRALRAALSVVASGLSLIFLSCAGSPSRARLGWSAEEIEAQRQCDAGQSVTACGELGRRLIGHHGSDKDLQRGLVLLEIACGNDDLTACSTLAAAYAQMVPHSARTLARARDLATRGCAGHAPEACTELGEVIFFEDAHNQKEASAALKTGCQLGDARGCELLGLLEERDQANGDKGAAAQAFAAACGLGRRSSCHRLAMARLDDASTQREGVRMLVENCEHGYAKSCAAAALLGAPVLIAKPACAQAIPLGEMACQGNEPMGCAVVDACKLRAGGPDADAVRARLWAACDRQMAVACLFAADGEEARARSGTKSAPETTMPEALRRAYAIACRDSPPGSAMAAVACPRATAIELQQAKTAEVATHLITKLGAACERSSGEACRAQAEAYRSGKWVPADPQKADQLGARACQLGCARCCGDGKATPPTTETPPPP